MQALQVVWHLIAALPLLPELEDLSLMAIYDEHRYSDGAEIIRNCRRKISLNPVGLIRLIHRKALLTSPVRL